MYGGLPLLRPLQQLGAGFWAIWPMSSRGRAAVKSRAEKGMSHAAVLYR